MGKNSGVEWTEHSWGPWYGGCSPRGPECADCYAKRDMKRYGRDPEVLTRSKTRFGAPLTWWEPATIFVCPWSDFFLEEADPWRPAAWDIIRETLQHVYIIPTKRPELIADRLPPDWGCHGYPNVALLVSAGTQESADRFIPELLRIPARWRGVSAEPLLESVNLLKNEKSGILDEDWDGSPTWLEMLDWLVIGAETRGAAPGRPCNLYWVRSLIEQATVGNIPVFVKKLHIEGRLSKDPAEWPAWARRREIPFL